VRKEGGGALDYSNGETREKKREGGRREKMRVFFIIMNSTVGGYGAHQYLRLIRTRRKEAGK